jgi:hypothetical protein
MHIILEDILIVRCSWMMRNSENALWERVNTDWSFRETHRTYSPEQVSPAMYFLNWMSGKRGKIRMKFDTIPDNLSVFSVYLQPRLQTKRIRPGWEDWKWIASILGRSHPQLFSSTTSAPYLHDFHCIQLQNITAQASLHPKNTDIQLQNTTMQASLHPNHKSYITVIINRYIT